MTTMLRNGFSGNIFNDIMNNINLISLSALFPREPNLVVGSYLNMSCNINLDHPLLHGSFDARNIYFEIHKTKIDNSYVTVSANYSQAGRATAFLCLFISNTKRRKQAST